MDLPRDVSELFAEEMAAKFLATADAEGKVNVALIVTLQPPPDGKRDRLIFGEFLMWKSKRNLEENPRVAAAVVNMKLKMVTLMGDFQGFEKKGDYKDFIDASPFMRYNAYSGVRAAGGTSAARPRRGATRPPTGTAWGTSTGRHTCPCASRSAPWVMRCAPGTCTPP